MKYLILGLISIMSMLNFSCGDKSSVSTTVKFTSTQTIYSESTGTISVPIALSAKESSTVTVNYTWISPTDTTYLGGDFKVTNIGSTTIPAGSLVGSIDLQIIDDTQIDGQDDIKFTITGVSGGNAKMSPTASELSTEILINDNDVAPDGKLQIDITWHLNDRKASINSVNLDFYAQYGVVTSGNSITDIGSTLSSSENLTGFETIFIDASDPDQDYYFAVGYASGSSYLTFNITLNGMGFSGENYTDYLLSSDLNHLYFVGPLTKSGSTFGRAVPRMHFKSYEKVAGLH